MYMFADRADYNSFGEIEVAVIDNVSHMIITDALSDLK